MTAGLGGEEKRGAGRTNKKIVAAVRVVAEVAGDVRVGEIAEVLHLVPESVSFACFYRLLHCNALSKKARARHPPESALPHRVPRLPWRQLLHKCFIFLPHRSAPGMRRALSEVSTGSVLYLYIWMH